MKAIVTSQRLFVVASIMALSISAAFGQQEDDIKMCASNPGSPDLTVIVTGFRGERLYIHPTHPDLCKNTNAVCRATSYVVPGDKIDVANTCGNWTYMTYVGKRSQTSGWVSAHFERIPAAVSMLPVPGEKKDSPLPAACKETAAIMNEWLKHPEGDPPLPSALSNTIRVDKFPATSGRSADDSDHSWGATVSDARIDGRPVKTIGYSAGGTCNASYLEVWDRDWKSLASILTAGTDDLGDYVDPGDDDGYSSEQLLQFQRSTVFAHITRSYGVVKLYAINRDLVATPMCDVVRVPSNREQQTASEDAELCDAVANGNVEKVDIKEIDPVDLDDPSNLPGDSPGGADQSLYAGSKVVAKGFADPFNDGHIHPVAMIQFSNASGAGCGHEFNSEWPVLLDATGRPSKDASNMIAFEPSGPDRFSRLIRFRGRTYFETKSYGSSDGVQTHDVWSLSPSGVAKMCSFNPVKYVAVHLPSGNKTDATP